MRMEVMKNSQL